MHNLIINFLTQNIQKKSKNLKNSKINKKLQNILASGFSGYSVLPPIRNKCQ
jgi:hypothetical protein